MWSTCAAATTAAASEERRTASSSSPPSLRTTPLSLASPTLFNETNIEMNKSRGAQPLAATVTAIVRKRMERLESC